MVFVLKTWREVSSKRREVIGFVMIFAPEEAGAVLILAVKLLSIKKKKKKTKPKLYGRWSCYHEMFYVN